MTDEEIRSKVKELLKKNLVSGYSKTYNTEYHYMKPSPGVYPYQYFWDTCFHVYTMTALGMSDMAKKCMTSLFAMQEEDGFVGHMLYWKSFIPHRITDIFQKKPSIKNFFSPHMTAFIQPPLPAQAVLRIFKTDGDKEFVKQILPKLKKYYRWIASNRDFEGKGLISIISYFEAGMDWKPSYDAVIGLKSSRADWKTFLKVVWIDFKNYSNGYNYQKIYKKNYFIVKDAGINTIYAQNLQAMANLCHIMNDPDHLEFENKAEQVRKSILEIMYDEEDNAFYDVYGKENKKLKVLTPTIFFPVVIKNMPDEINKKVIERHLFNKNEFDVTYPIPSVAVNHPSFNPNESMYIWRGPTWVIYNWYIHQFLMEKGYRKEATRMVESIKGLIGKSGFREYYNPFTGEGYGANDFTWSGLIVDMMNMEEGKTPETVSVLYKNQ